MTTSKASAPSKTPETLRPLGRSGIEVSPSGLGGNVFGGARLDRSASIRVLHEAIDLGVNLVDTANIYNAGESEEFIGAALAGRRDRMVIATKFNFLKYDGGSVDAHVRGQLEQSLRRLRTDHVDVYQLHLSAAVIDPEALLSALNDLVEEGDVRAIGVSNISSWRLAEWQALCAARGWARIDAVQNYYNLLGRHADVEMLPLCREREIGFLPYHPLAGGFLTGKYPPGQPAPEGTRGAAGSPIIASVSTVGNHTLVDRLRSVADATGRPLGELAVAWVAAQPGVSSVIAGVSSADQLRSNVTAAAWELEDEVRRAVDAATAPEGTFSFERDR